MSTTPHGSLALDILRKLKPAARRMLTRAVDYNVAGPQAAALARMGLVAYSEHVDGTGKRGRAMRRGYLATPLGEAVATLAMKVSD